MHQFKVTVAPAAEPVNASEVKRLLRVDFTDDDGDINDWIKASRQWLERKTGKALLTQTIQQVSTLYDEIMHAPLSGMIGHGANLAVELTLGPVLSVATVEFETSTNNWRALITDTEYKVDDPSPESPAYVYLADWVLGYWTGTFTGIGVFPVERRGPRLRVTYQAGYGPNPSDVPYQLREAVKQGAGFLYDNRSAPIPDSLLPSEYIPWRL
jgi:hypothetical protein